MTDIDRIKKLMKLTTSTFNGEALNAIRKANEELERNKQTWDDVLGGKRDTSFDKMLERSNMVLVKERDNLKNQLKESRSQIEDLKRACNVYKFASEMKKESRQTQFSEKEAKGYTYHREYVPKSKRRR